MMKSLITIGLLLLIVELYAKQLPAHSAAAKSKYAVEPVVKNEKKKETPIKFDLDPTRLPQNTAVAANSFVIFQCASTSSDNQRVQWWEYVYTPAADGAIISDNEFLFEHPNKDRYEIIHGDAYEYSLKINPVLLSDGGYYRCEDVNANPVNKRRHLASLTVVDPNYNCTSTVLASGVVIEGQYVSNECVFLYKGGLIPNMTWTGVLPFTDGYVATADSIWSGMHLNATREMNARAYLLRLSFTGYFLPVDADTADNIPTIEGYYASPQMFVYWGPTQHEIAPVKTSYVVGETLTCSADALPPATYLWQNLRTNAIYSGATLTIPEPWEGYNQTLRCQAQNTIEGTNYPSNVFLNVDVPLITPPPTTTPAPTTTQAPAVSPCTDLTGAWKSTGPGTIYSLCIFIDLNNRGVMSGLMKMGNEPFWTDLYGRAQIGKFDQIGFNGIWPAPLGVATYAGECHRCFGTEVLLVNPLSKTKGSPCGTGNPGSYESELKFERNALLQCPNYPKP